MCPASQIATNGTCDIAGRLPLPPACAASSHRTASWKLSGTCLSRLQYMQKA